MAVTITQLVAFLTAARYGSVTTAARQLVVTQPSVSSAINALQRELGVALMERRGRFVTPTPAGEAYLPYATDVLGLLERGARAAREAEDGNRATLRIGAVTTAGEHIVAPLLQTFRDAYPTLDLAVEVGNRAAIFRQLTDHEVDVAITGRCPRELGAHAVAFAPNQFVLVTRPEDPLAKMNCVSPEELSARPWLLREPGSGTRILTEDYLTAHELSPELLTLGSNGAIKQAVALGLGIAFQPRCAVALELKLSRLSTITLQGGAPQRRWFVLTSTAGPTPDHVAAFVAYTCSSAARRALAGIVVSDTTDEWNGAAASARSVSRRPQ
jgi:LysR family transcriptional regulator, low CO2-responsive transcriptional regulator